MTAPTFVYGLFDGASDEPRYIGLSSNPKRRLTKHIREARSGRHTAKCDWLRSLGAPPRLQMLATPSRSAAGDMERMLIRYYRGMGCRLTNVSDGGEGPEHHTDTRRAISAAAKRQMSQPDQRALRSRLATEQWRSNGTEMRAALAARGESWRLASAEASRRLVGRKVACPHCGILLSGLGGASANHIQWCASPTHPCTNCGEVFTKSRTVGRCHNCAEYFRTRGHERPERVWRRWLERQGSAQDAHKHGFVDEVV